MMIKFGNAESDWAPFKKYDSLVNALTVTSILLRKFGASNMTDIVVVDLTSCQTIGIVDGQEWEYRFPVQPSLTRMGQDSHGMNLAGNTPFWSFGIPLDHDTG